MWLELGLLVLVPGSGCMLFFPNGSSISVKAVSNVATLHLCPFQSQQFYSQVSTPLLRNIEFNYPQESVSDITQNSFHNYFGGSEIVVSGKVDTQNLQHLESVVTATAVSQGLYRALILAAQSGSFTCTWVFLWKW